MRVTLHDALVIPLLCGECAIPFIGTELLRSIDASQPELANAIAEQAAIYRENMAAVANRIVEVERILDTYELPRLRRPTTYDEFTVWADAACRAVLAATQPETPEGAVAAFSRTVVRVLDPLGLLAMVSHLREKAPEHETLRNLEAHLSQQLHEGVRQLTALSAFPTLPSEIHDEAQQLAATGRLALLLEGADPGTRRTGFTMIYRKMAELTRGVFTSLSSVHR